MCFLRWAVAVALVVGLAGSARADATPPLAMDEPKSGLHLSVEGGCQVRPADGGGAACQEYAASADKSDVFAVVLGPKGLFFYSVAIFAERELGGGVERARRVSTAMGGSVFGTPSEVTYGEQQFLRTQLRMSNGAAICFISADDRSEVAVIMFATDTESLAAMEPKAEAAMRSLRRAPKPPDAPAPTAPMSCGSRALITTFLVLLFGLPVVGFIRRATKQAKKKRKR
jgi:hypothetical protein